MGNITPKLFFTTDHIVCTKHAMLTAIVPLLVDWLTLGDLVRLHEALCDRDSDVPLELRHVCLLYTSDAADE